MKVGRNDPCPCGAKKDNGEAIKYKKCCLLKEQGWEKGEDGKLSRIQTIQRKMPDPIIEDVKMAVASE